MEHFCLNRAEENNKSCYNRVVEILNDFLFYRRL